MYCSTATPHNASEAAACATFHANTTGTQELGKDREEVIMRKWRAGKALREGEKDVVQRVIRQEYERGLKIEGNEEGGDGDDYWIVGDEGEGEGDGEFE